MIDSEEIKKHKIAIIGAGAAGCRALYLLKDLPQIEIVGIVDSDPSAPGVGRAHFLDLPVYDAHKKILNKFPDIILELTGDSLVYEDLVKNVTPKTEVISGPSIKVFFELLESIKYQKDKLNNIVRISSLISEVDNFDALVKRLVAEIALCLDVQMVGFLLYDPETDELVAQKPTYGIKDESLIDKYRIPLSFDTQIRDVFLQRKPFLSNDPYNEPKTLKTVLDMFAVNNVMTVALIAEDEALGVLHVANKRTGDFTETDLDLLASLSGYISVVIQNARLHRREQERFKELLSLLQASRSLTSAKNYQEILETVAEQANIMMKAKFGAVLLLDENSRNLKIVAGHNLSKSYIQALNEKVKVEVGQGTSGRAVEKKRAVWIYDVFRSKNYEPWKKIAETEGYRSVISLPLIYHDNAFGAISLYFTRPRKFREKEINLLSTMINDAAIAIENARATEQDAQNQIKIKKVHESSLDLMRILEPDKILKNICRIITEELNYDRAKLFLFNDKKLMLETKCCSGLINEKTVKQSFPFSQLEEPFKSAIWGRQPGGTKGSNQAKTTVFNDNSQSISMPIISRLDINKGKRINCEKAKLKKSADCWVETRNGDRKDFTKQAVLCSSCSKFKVFGVLRVDNSASGRPLTDQDDIALSIFIQNVTTAIDNALLHKQLERMAITDPLTGLYNRAYFHDNFVKELNRAKRFNEHLSFILLDLDNFKEFNDAYGHRKGDAILKQIAQIIKKQVRDFDITCRFGGDEFAIILPKADPSKAAKISDRIKKAILSANIKGKLMGKPFILTASIGLSTYPLSADNVETLIDFADANLYMQKNEFKQLIKTAQKAENN
jgi:diguanylate cyclase (GGDEF)-like protein